MAVFMSEKSEWYVDVLQDFFDNPLAQVRLPLNQGGARGDHNTVAENRHGQPLDVVRDYVVAALDQRLGLGGAEQRLGSARRRRRPQGV